MASRGPAKAPIVSSAWRRPKAAPCSARGVRSATSASRGAPRMPLPTRSRNRAATTQPRVGARANIGLTSAARPYPASARGLRLRQRSLSQPEGSFRIEATPSATPSMSPSAKALAPSVPTTKIGSSPWIISEETSMNRLTRPRAQMACGIRLRMGRDRRGGGQTGQFPAGAGMHPNPEIASRSRQRSEGGTANACR
jgi:hypothetical protein